VDRNGTNPNSVYNAEMGSGDRGGISFTSGAASGSKYAVKTNMAGKPVNFVSWFDAARVSNWYQKRCNEFVEHRDRGVYGRWRPDHRHCPGGKQRCDVLYPD
jgi:hypothetical protein